MTIQIPEGFSNGHLRFSLSGDSQEMSTAVGFESLASASALVEAETFLATFKATSLGGAPAICSDYTFIGVRVERQTATGTIVTEANDVTTGTGGQACLPSNCSMLVDKVTGAGGRKFRGRMFFPPIYFDEAIVDHNGYVASGTVSILQDSFDDWLDNMITAEIAPFLLHSSSADAPTFLNGFRVQQQIATQRERMR